MEYDCFLAPVKSGDVEAAARGVETGEVSLRAAERNLDEAPSYLIAAIRSEANR